MSSSEATNWCTTGLRPSSNATSGSRASTGPSRSWAEREKLFDTTRPMHTPMHAERARQVEPPEAGRVRAVGQRQQRGADERQQRQRGHQVGRLAAEAVVAELTPRDRADRRDHGERHDDRQRIGCGGRLDRVGEEHDDRTEDEHAEQRQQRPVAPAGRGPAAERRVRAEQRRGDGDGDRERQERSRAEGGRVVVQHTWRDEPVDERHHRCGHQRGAEQPDLRHLTPVGDGDHERGAGDADRGRHRDEGEQQRRLLPRDVAERPDERRRGHGREEHGGDQPRDAAGGGIRCLHGAFIGDENARLEAARVRSASNLPRS